MGAMTRCPYCFMKIPLTDFDDPDKKLNDHYWRRCARQPRRAEGVESGEDEQPSTRTVRGGLPDSKPRLRESRGAAKNSERFTRKSRR